MGAAEAASIGDVNGDGYSDVGFDSVYQSSPAGGPSPTSLAIVLTDPDRAGARATGLGDVNGDGYADVATSNNGYMDCLGRVYVYFGSAPGLSSTQLPVVLTGPDLDGEFGISLATHLPTREPRSVGRRATTLHDPPQITKIVSGRQGA
jgi:hypothetical protein